MLRACGLSDEDFDKPLIGISNSYIDIIPGHVHLREFVQPIKEEVRKADGEVIRRIEDPYSKEGGIAILFGNLAPRRCCGKKRLGLTPKCLSLKVKPYASILKRRP